MHRKIGGTATGVAAACWLLWSGAPAVAASNVALESAVFRAKPAVVMVRVRVTAVAVVRCGTDRVHTVQPPGVGRVGSGFIIHPEGWVVTNGHVVQLYYEQNEDRLRRLLLERAVAQACAPELRDLGRAARQHRLRGLMEDPVNSRGITLHKSLHVNLGNGTLYPGEVKLYSPAAFVEVEPPRETAGTLPGEHGRDLALVKITGQDLPVVPLARRSTGVHLGQEIFVIGFPGVVLDHELLSEATQFEPSVTVGHVSGFKQDLGGQRVIQTDAAIIQGNSGGPAFNDRGEVIGVATFTSVQGDQVVQGFNFLVPVETVHDGARSRGITPKSYSAFTTLWTKGVDLYLEGRHVPAYRHLSAASEIYAGFPDVERVKQDCLARVREQPFFYREEFRRQAMWIGGPVFLAALCLGWRWAAAARRRRLRQMIRQELEAAASRMEWKAARGGGSGG